MTFYPIPFDIEQFFVIKKETLNRKDIYHREKSKKHEIVFVSDLI